MKRQTEFKVPGTAAGKALADFLAARFPYHDRVGGARGSLRAMPR